MYSQMLDKFSLYIEHEKNHHNFHVSFFSNIAVDAIVLRSKNDTRWK